MEIEKLNKENKKLLESRLLYILKDRQFDEYIDFLLEYLSEDEKFRILMQIETMITNKYGDDLCLK